MNKHNIYGCNRRYSCEFYTSLQKIIFQSKASSPILSPFVSWHFVMWCKWILYFLLNAPKADESTQRNLWSLQHPLFLPFGKSRSECEICTMYNYKLKSYNSEYWYICQKMNIFESLLFSHSFQRAADNSIITSQWWWQASQTGNCFLFEMLPQNRKNRSNDILMKSKIFLFIIFFIVFQVFLLSFLCLSNCFP